MVATFFCVSGLSSLIALVLLKQRCRNGAARTNLLQVWFIYTKLAVSMAVQAILGTFPAALVRYDHARKVFS